MASPSTNKVVVLDRDGTIVVDRGYLGDPAALEFLPGAAEGLRWFHENGFKLVVITNQPGIGRGMFSADQLHEVHDKLREMMSAIGAPVAQIYHCPHLPRAHCDCRKPGIGLLLRAASELNFDPSDAIVIGNKSSDVEMGYRVGAKTVLISQRFIDPDGDCLPHFVAMNLLAATRAIKIA